MLKEGEPYLPTRAWLSKDGYHVSDPGMSSAVRPYKNLVYEEMHG
jgi:hypothetical protein